MGSRVFLDDVIEQSTVVLDFLLNERGDHAISCRIGMPLPAISENQPARVLTFWIKQLRKVF